MKVTDSQYLYVWVVLFDYIPIQDLLNVSLLHSTIRRVVISQIEKKATFR
jgi:hypothetical protein